MLTEEQILLLWGKTHKKDPLHFHPVLFHLLDVANVARLMWRECLNPVLQTRLEQALQLSPAEAEVAVVLLAGLHDLGKAAPAFQQKVSGLASALPPLDLKLEDPVGKEPHNFISAFDMPRLFEAGTFGWTMTRAAGSILASITGAHHGTFPRAENLTPHVMSRSSVGDQKWAQARTEMAQAFARNLFETFPAMKTDTELTDIGAVPLLAGLISVADWIGSSQYFKVTGPMDVTEYVALSRQRAREALSGFGWLPSLTPATPADFAAIFPFAPNDIQRRVEQIAQERTGPYLLIIEVPMGLGKTEAALFAADHAYCRSYASGFYVALPTQATSNAMFDRVWHDYLENRGHQGTANLHLAHGNALLSEAYQALRDAVIYQTQLDKNGKPVKGVNGRVAAQSWFTPKKQTLLATFGVGTIDQALLSVLQTNHWFVRLSGLANKVVIFDEVHAYDAYMSTLLRRLIHWLSELNCTVIILSATLPSAGRKALIEAYRPGASDALPDVPYPRVTWADKTGADALEVAPEAPRTVHLDFQADDPETVAALVQDALAEGGCAAVICNTVRRAQAVYQFLESQLPDWDLTLYHARMPFGWRRKREEATLAKFGKKAERPPRAVLIATQVAEQSLDLDWDWLASDMAPVDLLLQRLGREHRHAFRDAMRPARLKTPKLVILSDARPDGTPPQFEAYRSVYEPYILLRSWLAIRDKKSLSLPTDIEPLVEEVYVRQALPVPNAIWQTELDRSRQEMERRREADEKKAKGIAIHEPTLKPRYLIEKFNRQLEDDEDPTVHPTLQAATRSGNPSVQVICARLVAGKLVLPAPDPSVMTSESTPVPLAEDYDLPTAQRIMDASLPLSHKGLFHALTRDDRYQPKEWKKNTHFRYHRLLTFDADWFVAVDRYRLRLHPKLGLVIITGTEDTDD